MKEITLEEEFTQEELELILEMAEFMLDRDAYQDDDEDERFDALLSILRKLGSSVDEDEDEEEAEDLDFGGTD